MRPEDERLFAVLRDVFFEHLPKGGQRGGWATAARLAPTCKSWLVTVRHWQQHLPVLSSRSDRWVRVMNTLHMMTFARQTWTPRLGLPRIDARRFSMSLRE